MKKIILTIVFAVIAIVSMAQYRPVFVVADTSTAFGKTLSDRTLIYCAADSTIYATNGYNSSTDNINTGSVIRIAGGSLSVVVDTIWQRTGDTTQILNATDNLQVGSGFYYKGGSDYALAIGRDNNINGYGYSIYVGREIYGTGESQLIVGHWNDSLKTGNAFSVGTGVSGHRFDAFDVFRDSTTHVNWDLYVTGNATLGTGDSALYWNNTYFSLAFGNNTEANGLGSFAAGYDAKTIGNYSTAIGQGIETYDIYEMAVGVYNDTAQGKIFSVGLGSSYSSRFDALSVNKDSSIHINGRIVNKVSDTVVNIDTVGITINKIPTSVVLIVGELDSINITHNPQIDTTVAVGTMIELIGNDDTNVVRFENGNGLVIGGAGYIRLGNNDVATFRRIKGKGWILTNFQDN